MANPYKTYKMKLTTLSPVFIGSGEELNQSQYVFDNKTMTVKILDENKFSNFLIKNNLIDDYSNALMKYGGKINLKRWLEEKRIPLNYPIFSNSIPCRELVEKDEKSGKLEQKSSLNLIKTFVKNSDNLAYIPGSSIKGAIRTAFCSYIVNQNKDKFQKEWFALKESLLNSGKDSGKIIKQIETKCFKLIKCSDKKEENRDVFSTLIISDSESIEKNKLYITTRFDCANQKKSASPMPMYLELIEPNTDIYFNLTIDTGVTKYFSIEGIKKVLNFYARQQSDNIIYENCSEYLYRPDEISENYEPDFCIGGMTGFFNKNIVYSLAPAKQEAVNLLRRYFESKFKKHKHKEYDKDIAPHTIKAVTDNGDIIPLGWCNLSVEKEINVSDITN